MLVTLMKTITSITQHYPGFKHCACNLLNTEWGHTCVKHEPSDVIFSEAMEDNMDKKAHSRETFASYIAVG